MPINSSCSEKFTLSHALHCAKGGYKHKRYNEIRDNFVKIMQGVCCDVEVKPTIQLLQGEY